MAYGEEGMTRFANADIHQNVYHADTEILIEAHEASFETTFGIEERAAMLTGAIGTMPAGFRAAGALSLSHEVRAYGNNHAVRRYCSDSSVTLSAMVMHDDGASAYVGRKTTGHGVSQAMAAYRVCVRTRTDGSFPSYVPAMKVMKCLSANS